MSHGPEGHHYRAEGEMGLRPLVTEGYQAVEKEMEPFIQLATRFPSEVRARLSDEVIFTDDDFAMAAAGLAHSIKRQEEKLHASLGNSEKKWLAEVEVGRIMYQKLEAYLEQTQSWGDVPGGVVKAGHQDFEDRRDSAALFLESARELLIDSLEERGAKEK